MAIADYSLHNRGPHVQVAPDRRHRQIRPTPSWSGRTKPRRRHGHGRGAPRERLLIAHAKALLDYIDREKLFILPNTAGCYSADEAIRTARLGREVGLSNWVKLEVIGDERTLFPDNEALIEATRLLVERRLRRSSLYERRSDRDPGFRGCGRGPRSCHSARRSAPASGCRTSPASHPSRDSRVFRSFVDAGVGTASDAALAMELGADAVLMNTAIAGARESRCSWRRGDESTP